MRSTPVAGALSRPDLVLVKPAPEQPAAPRRLAPSEQWLVRGLQRFLVPSIVVRAVYLARFGAIVSGRAEVNLSRRARMGRGCVISSFTKIKIAGPFVLGRRVHIAAGSFLVAEEGGLEIGDDSMIGPNCTVTTSTYRYDRLDLPLHDQGFTSVGVRIGRNVWIGANSVVLDGAQIGDNVIVSAGSVVSGTIPANSIVQGNPAAVIFRRR
jgi:acetyltransferase-like isoleucine patch superfamily enzyme